MKKIVLFVGVFFCLLSMQAQFTVETHDGVPIEEGDVFTFNEIGMPAKLGYFITNTSSSLINIRAKFESVENADGSQMQLCITPTCYYEVVVGQSYPQEPEAMSVPIEAGDQTGYGNYFMNLDPGNDTEVIEYVFKLYQVDDNGDEIGTSITFTYHYDPLMGVEEVNNKLDISVYPTRVHDILNIKTQENLDMQVYNLQGRLVKSTVLSVGENQIEMSNLASQMYLVRFENEFGQSQTSKVIVQ